jgi:hypothetical protein
MSGLGKIAKISILLFLGTKLSFAQPTFPPEADPPLAESIPHFDIYAHDKNIAQNVKIDLESSYQRISSFLDDTLTQLVSVYVVDSDEEFRSMVGRGFPDWGTACAIPNQNLIVLKSPLHFNYNSNSTLSQLVAHELAHIFLGNLAKGIALPRWLDEGFAMHQSQEWRFGQDTKVAYAVFTGSLLRLSQIESVNAFRESKAELAYTESFLAVSYLTGEYGEEAIRELVDHLASGTSIDLAFLKTIGSNYLTFQLDFDNYIKSKYNWISFFGDTYLLWVGLAFLILFFYLVKKRHAKKILKEWELEERGIKRMPEGDADNDFWKDQTQI